MRAETFRDDLAHVEEPLRAIAQAAGLAGAQLAPRSACDALVPALARHLADHLAHHHLLLLLLRI